MGRTPIWRRSQLLLASLGPKRPQNDPKVVVSKISKKKAKKISWKIQEIGGGGDRDRTDDPQLAKLVLSQLSYAPTLGKHSGFQ
jgi:hypothetical protein